MQSLEVLDQIINILDNQGLEIDNTDSLYETVDELRKGRERKLFKNRNKIKATKVIG